MLYSKIEGIGKPLLILHGFLGMSDNWKTLSSHYASEGFQVHLLDLRNHGRSFHSDDFSYDFMVQDVFEYCQSNALKKIDIIGHSMGGKVAMLFSVKFPLIVDKLVIADIGPKYYKPHHQAILAGLNAIDFSQKPDRGQVEEVLKKFIPDVGTRQFLMKSLYWMETGQLGFRFNLKVFNVKIDEIGVSLPEKALFSGPTLFLRGGNSSYILDEDFAGIQKQFPNATFVTIPNVGHWLHAENPTLFLEETLKFLK
jgi:pimeloyl-ACP methyl ester carboxylesterase